MPANKLHTLVLLVVTLSSLAAAACAQQSDDAGGSPGWAPTEAEDLATAAAIDVSKPPKTCRPEILSKIDFGVATAAYQASHER